MSSSAEFRLLVVDDDATVRRSLRRLLAALPLVIEDFGDPREALARFEASPFDAVITDVEMPHMNGIELSQRLRAIVPNLPVILCTGAANAATRAHDSGIPFFAVVDKPWEAGAMRQLMRSLLAARMR